MRSNRGFSLIETMVGAAILLTVSLSVAYLAKSPSFDSSALSNSQDACRAIASEVLNRVREHGSQAAVIRWAPTSPSYSQIASDNLFENLKGGGTLSGRGGTSTDPIVGDAEADTPGILNNHLLYLDSMNILTSILNTNAAACSDPEGVSVAALTGPNTFGALISGTDFLEDYEWLDLTPGYPRIAVRPRNLSMSGNPINCNARSRPKSTVIPYREALPALADDFQVAQIGTPAEEDPDWGYQVDVWVKYQPRGSSSQEQTCQLTQMFTHKRVAPPTIQLSVATTNSTLETGAAIAELNVTNLLRSSGTPLGSPANFTEDKTRSTNLLPGQIQSCSAPANNTNVTAIITPRAGSMLYCRDRSRMRYVPTGNSISVPPSFSYFANIVNKNDNGAVSLDRLTYIRHNWAFLGGTLNCNLANGCRSFPPVPLDSGATVTGVPTAPGITTTSGTPDGPITDSNGVSYSRYFYLPSLAYSGGNSALTPPRAVPQQYSPIITPWDQTKYENVIISLFGQTHRIEQAEAGEEWGWVPCHQLTTNISASRRANATVNNDSPNGCLRTTGSSISLNYNTGSGQFTFNFNNLKRGCEIVIDVVEVDPARSISSVFNDFAAFENQLVSRNGRAVATISEYVAEQSPGSAICYDEASPTEFFFKCGPCAGSPSETPVPDYVEPPIL